MGKETSRKPTVGWKVLSCTGEEEDDGKTADMGEKPPLRRLSTGRSRRRHRCSPTSLEKALQMLEERKRCGG